MAHDQQIDNMIITIVQTESIAEQSDLQHSLQRRGMTIPQATLSRRLKKLKIAKIAGYYKPVDYAQANVPLVVHMKCAEQGLIVLHTHPGNASSLAYYLDRKFVTFNPEQAMESGILGTIAGDDTVLVILTSPKAQDKVYRLLRNEFPYVFSV